MEGKISRLELGTEQQTLCSENVGEPTKRILKKTCAEQKRNEEDEQRCYFNITLKLPKFKNSHADKRRELDTAFAEKLLK